MKILAIFIVNSCLIAGLGGMLQSPKGEELRGFREGMRKLVCLGTQIVTKFIRGSNPPG